jgi:hypothetical protein
LSPLDRNRYGLVTYPNVLAGLITRPELAKQLRCGERTVIRRERAGMPFIAVGMARLYDPARVRDWLMSQERCQDAPRRGRPRKAA